MAVPLSIPVPATTACSMGQVSDQKDADPPVPSDLDGLIEDYLADEVGVEDFYFACFNENMAEMGASGKVHSEICAESNTLAVTDPTVTPVSDPPVPSDLDGLIEDYLAAEVGVEDFYLACFNENMAEMGASGKVHSEICAESNTLAVTDPTVTPVSAPEQSLVPILTQTDTSVLGKDFSLSQDPFGLEVSEILAIPNTAAAQTSRVPESEPEQSNVLFSSQTELESHEFYMGTNLVESLVAFGFSEKDLAAEGIHVEGEAEISIESERVAAPTTVSRSTLNIESETMAAPTTAVRSALPMMNQEMQRGAPTILVELSGNGALVPLEDKAIYHEVDVIAGTMFGISKYVTMKRSGYDFVKFVLDSLPENLRELQEKGKKEIASTLSKMEFHSELKNMEIIKQDLEDTGTTTEMLSKLIDHENNLVEMLDSVYFPMSLKLKKRADETFLSGLVSNLPQSLKDIQERNDIVVTLEEVKNEASKLIYIQLNGEKAAAHPPHIQSIPGIWRREHLGCRTDCVKTQKCKFCRRTCYPPLPVSQSIANYTGLWLKQVQGLFQNERKRKAPKDPLLGDGQLLKHFDEGVIEILRDWKANHPGKELPDGATVIDLMSATGMDETQIRNWFGNNATGREKRNHPLKRRNTENI